MLRTGEANRKCWDIIQKRWKPCPPLLLSSDSTGKSGSPCCVPKNCCFDCKDLIDLTKCMQHLQIYASPSVIQPNQFPIIGPNFGGIQFAYNLSNCRFELQGGGIYDNHTSSLLTCYIATEVTNSEHLIPYPPSGTYTYPMCIRLAPQIPQCPELGICFNINVVEFQPTFYTFRVSDVAICKNVDAFSGGDGCNSCPESIVPPCVSEYSGSFPTIFATQGSTFQHSFEVCIDECCLNDNGDGEVLVWTFFDDNIQSIPNPAAFNLSLGCNTVTVTYDVPITANLGGHSVAVLVRTLCDDYYFLLKVFVS